MKKETKGRRSGSSSVNHEKRALIRLMLTGAYAIPLMATISSNPRNDDDDLLVTAQAKKGGKAKGRPSTLPGKGKAGGKGKAKGRPF